MYITKHRAKAIAFTYPYLRVNATLLLRKPLPGQQSPIETISDLIYQSEIRYGSVDRGVIYNALQSTNTPTFKHIWRNMERWGASVLTSDLDEGINKVRNRKYGFFLPDSTADYITARVPCDLLTVGHVLPSRGYGLAVRHSDPLIYRLNVGIKGLVRNGRIQQIYEKWWYSTGECERYHYLTDDHSSSNVMVVMYAALWLSCISTAVIVESLW